MPVLIAAVAGFASGVGLRSLFYFGWEVTAFTFLLAALFILARVLTPRQAYVLGALFFAFAALGMLRMAASEEPLPAAFMADYRKQVRYEGVVVADPDIRDRTQRVQIEVSKGEETTKILAVANKFPEVGVGDRVHVSGLLLTPQPFSTDGGRVFRYDKYLEREGVRFIFNFATLRVTERAPAHSVPAAFARAKHAFIGGLQATLPEPHASLAGGITIGGKSGLGTEIKNAFTRSGLVHMVVLSGHNVMVVASWAIACFAFAFAKMESVFGRRVPRSLPIALGVVALILFIGIAGASATAIRAGVMAVIALYARATGRTYAAGRALLFVILLMLLWNPLYLVFDPGFGLSVTATAGLIWLAPIIEDWLQKRFGLTSEFWKNVIATTLAAQIAVLPLLLYETGNLSIVALPANLLATPLIPLAMGMSALAGFAGILFGSVLPAFGVLLAFPSYLLNAYLIFVARESAALPFAAYMLPLFPFSLVLASYAALIYAATTYRFSTTPQLRLAKKAST